MNKKKIILIILAVVLVIAIGIGGYTYKLFTTSFDNEKTVYVYVDENKDYNRLMKQLETEAGLRNKGDFNRIASMLSYPEAMKTGRFAIEPGMTYLNFIRHLRSGHQSPVRLTFNNVRLKADLAKRLSEQLMFSNEDLMAVLNDEKKCEELGFNTNTIVVMFIPNTYEFYWNTSVDQFVDRMNKEYKKFWNADRLAKAERLGLTPIEVSTLASIVEEECTYSDEYSTVAGLYLNRLKIGQKLQADPTVKFAVGDFSLRRILYAHLEVESPYNTYKYAGLPPSPIRIPSIKGLDSVLNYKEHNYYYMCAKEDFSGRHNFAATHAEHERNAARYRNALNARGIR